MILDVNGLRVSCENYGNGENKLLMLHGWGCSSEHFRQIAEKLSDRYRILVPDLPGHGLSGQPKEPWGVDDYADCVLSIMESAGFDRASVIAHSFGGRIALKIASGHPEKIDRMILTGCAGLKKPKTPEQLKKEEEYRKGKERLLRIGRFPPLKKYSRVMLDDLRRRYGSADYNALDPGMRETFVRIVSEDLRPCLAGIRCPVLLVWGREDWETPLWMGETMEKEIPDAGLVVFDNDDHFAYLHQWPRFTTIAESFLQS